MTTIEDANRFIQEVYIPAHNARFAVKPSRKDRHSSRVAGTDLAEDPVHPGGAQGRSTTIPSRSTACGCRSRRARCARTTSRPSVKVRQYHDGTHAIFHGPRCLARYDREDARRRRLSLPNQPRNSAPRQTCGHDGQRKRVAHMPTGEQTQKSGHLIDVLRKPANYIRYRQPASAGLIGRRTGTSAWATNQAVLAKLVALPRASGHRPERLAEEITCTNCTLPRASGRTAAQLAPRQQLHTFRRNHRSNSLMGKTRLP